MSVPGTMAVPGCSMAAPLPGSTGAAVATSASEGVAPPVPAGPARATPLARVWRMRDETHGGAHKATAERTACPRELAGRQGPRAGLHATKRSDGRQRATVKVVLLGLCLGCRWHG